MRHNYKNIPVKQMPPMYVACINCEGHGMWNHTERTQVVCGTCQGTGCVLPGHDKCYHEWRQISCVNGLRKLHCRKPGCDAILEVDSGD